MSIFACALLSRPPPPPLSLHVIVSRQPRRFGGKRVVPRQDPQDFVRIYCHKNFHRSPDQLSVDTIDACCYDIWGLSTDIRILAQLLHG